MNSPASRFFSALFSDYPADETLRLEIRPLLPEWKKAELTPQQVLEIHRNVRRWYVIEPQYLQNAAQYAADCAESFDVYYGVFPRIGRTGSQNDVPCAHALFCDVDGGDEGIPGAIARIKSASIDLPDIAVQSGGGIHCYWLLDEPVPLPDKDAREAFKRTLRRLCLAIGGTSPAAHADPAAAEVARILRVPGTFNHKRENEPRPVKMLRYVSVKEEEDGIHGTVTSSSSFMARSYAWWRAHLPAEERVFAGPKARAATPFIQPGTISPGLARWAEQGYPEGKRHQDFVSAAAWLVRDVKVTKEQARDLLRIKAQNSPGRRPITDEEIEAAVKWA